MVLTFGNTIRILVQISCRSAVVNILIFILCGSSLNLTLILKDLSLTQKPSIGEMKTHFNR